MQRYYFSIDIMYINAIPSEIEITGNIQYSSAQTIPDQTFKSIYNASIKIIKIYIHFGFSITHITGVGEYEQIYTKVIIQHSFR